MVRLNVCDSYGDWIGFFVVGGLGKDDWIEVVSLKWDRLFFVG